MPKLSPPPAPRRTPHGLLLAAIEDLELTRPRAIPCRGPEGNLWVSERPSEQAAAVAACGHCPVRAACGDYALAAGEEGGVWGGLVTTVRANARRRRKSQPEQQRAAAS